MTLKLPNNLHLTACSFVAFGALGAVALPASASPLVATEDVAICHQLVDLEELELRLKANDKAGSALYLDGAQPACMIMQKGEAVAPLDRSGSRVQVVTDHGTPRFIGWGKSSSFR